LGTFCPFREKIGDGLSVPMGMLCHGDALSRGRFVQGMDRPRDGSSRGRIVQGAFRPGMHRTGMDREGTDRQGTLITPP
jgi:hypothetical protein